MLKRIGLFLAVFFILSSCSYAEVSGSTTDPSDLGVGARPLALGKSYVGMSDDGSGVFVNPAGLANISGLKVTSMTGQVLQDLSYNIISGAYPTEMGTLGIGYINVGLGSIPVTTITGSGTTAVVVPAGSTNYSASVTTLSYSNSLSKIEWFKDQKNITYGVNIKYFAQGFSGGGHVMEGASGNGFDMDAGIQYKPRKELTLGVAALNFLPESLGGRFVWDKSKVTENIPAVAKVGGTIKLFGSDSCYGGKQNVFLGVDMDTYPSQPRPAVYHTGVEWWPISVMALRLGIDQKPKGTEDGVGTENNLAAGIGLKYKGFTFDYCYHQFSDLTDNTTHFFSVGYVGIEEAKETEKPKRIINVIVPSVSLKSFSDVPQGYWAKSPIEFMAAFGVMNGYHDGKFRPDDGVTRSELASMLVKLRQIDVNEATSDPFPDVKKDYWASKYIKAVSYMELMGSYPDGTFKPDKKITRVEGVVILARYTDAKEPSNLARDPFADVKSNHWAAKYVAAAQSYGLLDYLIGKNFEPNRELSRAEMAELLSKTSYGKDRIRKYIQGI